MPLNKIRINQITMDLDSTGCIPAYNNTTTITILSGVIAIYSKSVTNTSPLTLAWTDIDVGTSKQPNTFYYIYVTNTNNVFDAFISHRPPTRDTNDNTINSYSCQAKYHPTLPARFVGSFRTNASSNIIQFTNTNGYMCYVGLGYNFILTSGAATTKTAVNCSLFVPPTSAVAQVYCEGDTTAKLKYVGDNTTWYAKLYTGTSISIPVPIIANNIYYQCVASGKLSIGIHGYYESIS